MARKYSTKKTRKASPRLIVGAGIGALVLIGGAGAAYMVLHHGGGRPASSDPKAVALIELKNAVQADPDNPELRLELGRVYVESGQGASAVKELETARRLGDDSDELAILLARAHYLSGESNDALNILKDRSFAPDYQDDSLILQGQALLSTGKVTDAQQAFDKAEQENPESIDAKLGQAQVAARNNEAEKAGALLDQVLAKDPENIQSLLMKAELARQKGDMAGSTDYFSKVLGVDPRHLMARMGRIDNYLNSGRYEDARVDLDFVERTASANPLVSYLWSKYYARTGDMQAASNRLQQAEKLIPNHLPTIYLRAVIAYSQNNLEQAHHNLERVLEAAPRDIGARRLMAATLVRQKEAAQAIPLLKSLVADGVADANVHTLMARAQMETGDYAGATESFDAAIKLSKDPAALKTQRALSKLAQGDAAEAMQDLQNVVKEDEDSLQARVLMVMLSLRDRQYETALSQAEDMAKQFPDNPLAQNLRGAALIGLNRLDDAHAAFAAALETDPDYVPAAIYLARLESRTGQVDSAIARYEALLAKDQNNVNALVDLANIRLAQGDQDKAVAYLEKAMNARPDVTGPGLRLVNLYISTGQAGKALSEANVLLQNHRDDPQVLEMVGRAQLAAGETANSVLSFRRLTNMLPQSGPAQFLLGVSLRQSGDTDAARDAFRKAIDLTPAFAPSYRSLVSLEAESGNLEGALELAEDLRKSMPDSPVGDVFTGDIYLRRNNPEQALAAFNAAWQKAPQFPIAVRLYRAHAALGQVDEGLALMQQWVDQHQQDEGARNILASSYLDAGKYPQAIQTYEALLGPDSKDAVALNNLAWLYQQTGDDRDVPTARAAYELKPDVAAIADTYGWILLSRGRAADALPILQKAAGMAPADADIRYHFAKALAENGKTEAALREAQSVLGLNGSAGTVKLVQALIDGLK